MPGRVRGLPRGLLADARGEERVDLLRTHPTEPAQHLAGVLPEERRVAAERPVCEFEPLVRQITRSDRPTTGDAVTSLADTLRNAAI